jgi:hypothetical protein
MLIVEIILLAVLILLVGLKTRILRKRKNNLMDHILIIVLVRRMDAGKAIVSAFIKVKAVIQQNANVKIVKIRMIMQTL